MKKRLLALTMVVAMAASLVAGCGSNSKEESTTGSTELPEVSLTMWGSENDQDILREMADAFIEKYADQATITITLDVESESTCKDTILTDVEAAADVFAFADDQLNELVQAGALQEVTLNADTVISDNGGEDSGSVQAASYDGKLYAYPMTADNGYFMYYDSSVFTEEDVKTLDGMIAAAEAAGKTIAMDLANGWYLYSFFQGAGLELTLNDDGVTNTCTWNATDTDPTGAEVAQAILDAVADGVFVSLGDTDIVSGIQAGTVCAAVSGTWNSTAISEAWSDNYAATKLPTYTVDGEQVQMSSYAGYKLVGVNAYSDNVGYAMLLAQWITNYDNQVYRFEQKGYGPSNVEAASSDAVAANPAIAALSLQSAYATVQRVGGNFWDPAATLGQILANGNPDGTDLQELLDTAVSGIEAAVE